MDDAVEQAIDLVRAHDGRVIALGGGRWRVWLMRPGGEPLDDIVLSTAELLVCAEQLRQDSHDPFSPQEP